MNLCGSNSELAFFGVCKHGLHTLFIYGGNAMKKLKTWQLVLLIIFYPVGIVYFIVWLCNRNKQKSHPVPQQAPENFDYDIVFVNKGSKVYHCDQMCADSRSCNSEEMKEKEAIKKGLHRCKKCWGTNF